MKKWVKVPGPGQVRGEGFWEEARDKKAQMHYDYCKRTGWLPVAESDEMPVDISSETT